MLKTAKTAQSVSYILAAAFCGLLVNAVSLGQFCYPCGLCPGPEGFANPSTVCAGGVVHIVAGPAAGPCSWEPAAEVEDPTSCDTTARPLQSTVYLATFIDSFLCVKVTAGVEVTVPPSPPAPLITAPATASPGETGLMASVPLHQNGYFQSSYEWTITNGEITSGQGTNVITFSVASSPVAAGRAALVEISVVETPPQACPSEKATSSVAINVQPVQRRPRTVPFR
jgi:hypothetical protein